MWWTLVQISLLVGSYFLRIKPKQEKDKPPSLGEFDLPTSTEGRPVPVIWGRVKLNAPNIMWTGNFSPHPIRDEANVTIIGHAYFLGIQFGLCRGPIDGITRIWVDDTVVYSLPITDDTLTRITHNTLFGGENQGGGINGYVSLHVGDETQDPDTYLELFQDPIPGYRGTAYLVAGHKSPSGNAVPFYFGNRASLAPWAFEIERYPNQLAMTSSRHRIGDGANPMCVLYELLTNTEYGRGRADADINAANLRTVGNTLYTENNGFRYIWDTESDIDDLISEIERQVDGRLFIDPVTGKYDFKLIRNDYDVETIEILNEDNIIEMVEKITPTWQDTAGNVVWIRFADPRNNYQDGFGLAIDRANQLLAGAPNTNTINFPGVMNHELANAIAWRELRAVSFPASRGSLYADRSQWGIFPGDVRLLQWSTWNDMVIRVTKVDYGSIDENRIKIEWTQDIFHDEPGSFADPPSTDWEDNGLDPEIYLTADQVAIDAPRQAIHIWGTDTMAHARIMSMARNVRPSFNSGYFLRARKNASGSYLSVGTGVGYTFVGQLRDNLLGLVNGLTFGSVYVDKLSDEYEEDPEIEVVSPIESLINSFGPDDIGHGMGVAVISPGTDEEEWIVCSGPITADGDGIRLRNTYRGAFDSPISAHSAGDRIWFPDFGGRAFSTPDSVDEGNDYDCKLVPFTLNQSADESDCTATSSFEVIDPPRAERPLLPTNLFLNTVFLPATVDTTYDTGGGVEGIKFEYDRRNYRTDNPFWSVVGYNDDGVPYSDLQVAIDQLQYHWWLYDLVTTPSPSGHGDAILNGSVTDGAASFIITKAAIEAVAAGGVVPATMRIEISSTHFSEEGESNVPSRSALVFDFDAT